MTNSDPLLKLEYRLGWIYLVNLVFYFIPLFINDYPWWQIVVSVLAVPPFLWCYFQVYHSAQHQAWKPIVGIVVIASLMMPFNSGALSLYVFAGFFVGFFYSRTTWFFSVLSICMLMTLLAHLSGYPVFYFLTWGVGLVSAISLFGIAEQKRQRTHFALKQSEQEISMLATMVERERIARDLHDLMGHNLSSIALKAELAQRLLDTGKQEECRQQLVELQQISRESLTQIRQTVADYKHKGLAHHLAELTKTLRDKGLQVTIAGDLPTLAHQAEKELIMVLTELTNNILRHSQASSCSFEFSFNGTDWLIQVSDNGRCEQIKEGNGLAGIRERLSAFGGKLNYQLQQGCQFMVQIPGEPK